MDSLDPKVLLLGALPAIAAYAFLPNTRRRRVRDSHAVITGGSSGIGLALAREFVREGVSHARLGVCQSLRGETPRHACPEALFRALFHRLCT